MKTLPYISTGITAVALPFNAYQLLSGEIVSYSNKFLSLILFGALITLTSISWKYWYQKYRTVPHLIRLKGLCAVTHELRDIVTRIPIGTLKNEPAYSIVKSLIISAHGRATELAAAGEPTLVSVRNELWECSRNDCSEDVIRRHIDVVFRDVDDIDVKHLRNAGVAHIVYPSKF